MRYRWKHQPQVNRATSEIHVFKDYQDAEGLDWGNERLFMS